MSVVVAGTSHQLDVALRVVAGYAFATVDFDWQPTKPSVGDRPASGSIGRWAYRTYDCVPPAAGNDLAGIDLFIADGLNGQLRASTVAAIVTVAPEVSVALGAIAPNTTSGNCRSRISSAFQSRGTPPGMCGEPGAS